MTPTSTPHPQISPPEADRIQTHARSILEGEGQDEHDPVLVEAVARALAQTGCSTDYPMFDLGGFPMQQHWYAQARAALSTIRKHQAGDVTAP